MRVSVDPVEQGGLPSALDIIEEKDGFQPPSADERNGLAVRRNLRTDRPALSVNVLFGLACLEVEPLDHVDDAVRILIVLEPAAGAHILTIVEVAAVRREARFSGILFPVAPFGELQSVAPSDVVHPHLPRAEGPGIAIVLARDDELPVRGPNGIIGLALLLFGDLLGILPVDIHDPDVIAPVPVAGEGYLFSVRAEARLHLVGGSSCEQLRLSSRDRHEINIAE